MFPVIANVPQQPAQVHEYVTQKKMTIQQVFQLEFIDHIDAVLKVLALPKILGGDKREMVYNLDVLKKNIKHQLMRNKSSYKMMKLYLLNPVRRCLVLVKEKGFCHTQKHLMTDELLRLKNRFIQMSEDYSHKV